MFVIKVVAGKDKPYTGVFSAYHFEITDKLTIYQDPFEKGNAVPYIDIVDSIRLYENETSKSVDRTKYKIIQTPQIFSAGALHKAYLQPYCKLFTDDASIVEKAGQSITLYRGNKENIKITSPFDIIIAQAFLSTQ